MCAVLVSDDIMSEPVYIFELSESTFESSALQNSHQIPVLALFMGVWSGPCIATSDRIADLAQEFAGKFIFAKIDIDEQQGLRNRYNIENVPTLVVLHNGEEVHREVGELQIADLRALLKQYNIYRESDDLREQARAEHMTGNTQQAILLLTQAIQSDPSNVRVALDMVQIFLDIEEWGQAKGLFARLPDKVKQDGLGQSIVNQLRFVDLAEKTAGIESLRQQVISEPDNWQVHFDLALCLLARLNSDEAVEHLFTIQEKAPDFLDGAARELIGLLANMWSEGSPDAAKQLRQRLANITAA
jgi:putative thioredoxin